MRFKPLLCCLLLLTCPLVGRSSNNAEFVEVYENGVINWSRGIITARGQAVQTTEENYETSPPEIAQQAYHQAFNNMLALLHLTRIDALTRVGDRIATDENMMQKLRQMADIATVLNQDHQPDGKVMVTMQFRLRGGFAQLILPPEIKQVEPIKPMTNASGAVGSASSVAADEAGGPAEAYTGLVVDARGINVHPAMVPLIVDENGRELYSPDFISREYAVQQGVVEYVCDMQDSSLQLRVGPKALVLKALRARSDDGCDLVVSNADAARLRDVCANLDFLKKCRVIIVVDRAGNQTIEELSKP